MQSTEKKGHICSFPPGLRRETKNLSLGEIQRDALERLLDRDLARLFAEF
jgi:hypothetical protein